ncbi:MAG: glycosyltransferase family 9 protein [Endomicrobium sp.]|jgi:ADP-heptose:LPS heptosyltransferase|nr:glycosyltransferase family 9 protein [Endomicrobium sp.]
MNKKKILVVLNANLGDFILATSALNLLKKNSKNSIIYVIAQKRFKPYIENNPAIDNIIYNNNLFSADSKRLTRRLREVVWFVKNFIKLKFLSFDTCIFLDSSPFLALAANILIIKTIAGPATRWCGYDKPFPILKYLNYIVKMNKDSDRIHISERYQTIIRSIINTNNIELPVLPDTSHIKSDIVEAVKNDKNKKIVFCFEGYGGYNRFPFNNAIDTINAVLKHITPSIYFVGTCKNNEYASKIAKSVNHPIINLCGSTSLHELKEVLRNADLLISIDTGVVHLAAAENIKIISLYGPGLPDNSGPMSSKAHCFHGEETCSPCHFKRETESFKCPMPDNPICLANINPYDIANKAIEMLEEK